MITLKFTLRKKLLFFSVILALIPLMIAGHYMIRITRDELKSFLNDELIVTADQFAKDIDNLYIHTWLAPLQMMKRVVESDSLGPSEKVSVLTNIRDVADIVSLQISIEGTETPILIMQNSFTTRLKAASADPSAILLMTHEQIEAVQAQYAGKNLPINDIFNGEPEYIPEIDSWLISVIISLKDISGRKATLSAKINLDRIKTDIENHPFNKTGNIMMIYNGKKGASRLFSPESPDFNQNELVKTTQNLLNNNIRTIGVQPYLNPAGEKILAGYAFPLYFDWAIVVEKNALKAYMAVAKMTQSLFLIILIGLAIAVIGAIIFANRIGQPIIEISRVVQKVGKGDFEVRVKELKSKDEISDLGKRINEMINGLSERFQLLKFVSLQTMKAIKNSKNGVQLGGRRITATVFFSDIRGFTSFSEKYEPEEVIEMLNTYLRCQAEIVRNYGGDIDKYVGDELVAVFQGKNMVRHAVLCAVEIHRKIQELNRNNSEWGDIFIGIGINTGIMIMGAMGSEERMDYTILGDNVNLGARLCSYAGPGETVLSDNAYKYLCSRSNIKNNSGNADCEEDDEIDPALSKVPLPEIIKDEEIRVKGKSNFIQIYRVKREEIKNKRRTHPAELVKWYK